MVSQTPQGSSGKAELHLYSAPQEVVLCLDCEENKILISIIVTLKLVKLTLINCHTMTQASNSLVEIESTEN